MNRLKIVYIMVILLPIPAHAIQNSEYLKQQMVRLIDTMFANQTSVSKIFKDAPSKNQITQLQKVISQSGDYIKAHAGKLFDYFTVIEQGWKTLFSQLEEYDQNVTIPLIKSRAFSDSPNWSIVINWAQSHPDLFTVPEYITEIMQEIASVYKNIVLTLPDTRKSPIDLASNLSTKERQRLAPARALELLLSLYISFQQASNIARFWYAHTLKTAQQELKKTPLSSLND